MLVQSKQERRNSHVVVLFGRNPNKNPSWLVYFYIRFYVSWSGSLKYFSFEKFQKPVYVYESPDFDKSGFLAFGQAIPTSDLFSAIQKYTTLYITK